MRYYLDTETWKIEPGLLIPPLVCLQDEEGIHLARDSHDIVEAHLDAEDTFVAHSAAFDAAVLVRAFPDLAERIYHARWECTKVKEQLIYIAKNHPFKGSYSLAACLKRHGIDGGYTLDAGGQKDEYWRLHYSELDGVPVEDWPEAAVRYAMLDVENVKDLDEWQNNNVPSVVWADLEAQTRADLDLHLLTSWGVHTDSAAVERFITKVTNEKTELEKALLVEGLITHKGKKRQKLAKERATKAFVDMGLHLDKVPLTPKGRQLLELTPDIPAGELLPDYTSVDKDSCLLSGDPALVQYARYGSVNTLLKRGKRLREGVYRPLQPRYNVLVESGRTSCSQGADGSSTLGFQIQNVHREPGLRECFIPRPGKVFFAADWSGAELHTLAEACNVLVGYSTMGEKLNQGIDLHMDFGAQLMGVSYKEAQRRRKAGDKHAKDMRQMAKCFHPDVEVLTKRGWVAMKDMDPNEKVATPYVKQGCKVEMKWEVPLRLTKSTGRLTRIHNQGIDLRVTEDHRMVGWTLQGNVRSVTPKNLNLLRYIPNVGMLEDGGSVDPDILRLAIAIQADGSYSGRKVKFGFTKKRKIHRLEELCAAVGVDVTWKEYEPKKATHNTQYHTSIGGDAVTAAKELLTAEKTLGWNLLGLAGWLREIILDEAQYWDAHKAKQCVSYQYFSAKKENMDVLQAIASITNRKSRQKGNSLTIRKNAKTRGGTFATTPLYGEQEVMCLTTRSDCILVRDGGVPVITHQCADFGFPGGLGALTFVVFAHESYGVVLTVEEAKALKAKWLVAFPEMPEYFNRICESGQPVEQLYSKRLRGGASYCATANTFFQGLAADMMKDALHRVVQEMYFPGGPWYMRRARLWGEIHDELIGEAPLAIAPEVAERVSYHMAEAGKKWCPSSPPTAEPLLMSRWSKSAETVRDAHGRLQVFQVEEV